MMDDLLLKEDLPNIDLLFGQLWEISVDGMRLIDEDGKILLVNDSFCKKFQMEKDNLLGKPFSIVYKKMSRKPALELIKGIFEIINSKLV
jgi:PAS domain S-box-containing protein